jgi:hypothetical protein
MARERAARRSGRHRVGATASVAPVAAAGGSGNAARGLEGFGTAGSILVSCVGCRLQLGWLHVPSGWFCCSWRGCSAGCSDASRSVVCAV